MARGRLKQYLGGRRMIFRWQSVGNASLGRNEKPACQKCLSLAGLPSEPTKLNLLCASGRCLHISPRRSLNNRRVA